MKHKADTNAVNSAEPTNVEHSSSTDLADGPQAREEFSGQRLVDLLLATVTITFLSPLILLRAGLSLITSGRLLERQENVSADDDASISNPPARFSGRLPGSGLASP